MTVDFQGEVMRLAEERCLPEQMRLVDEGPCDDCLLRARDSVVPPSRRSLAPGVFQHWLMDNDPEWASLILAFVEKLRKRQRERRAW